MLGLFRSTSTSPANRNEYLAVAENRNIEQQVQIKMNAEQQLQSEINDDQQVQSTEIEENNVQHTHQIVLTDHDMLRCSKRKPFHLCQVLLSILL
jgi:hypothetical protein